MATAAAATATPAAPSSASFLLKSLNLQPSLRSRINEVYPAPRSSQTSTSPPPSTKSKPANNAAAAACSDSDASSREQQLHRLDAVLYLPTVLLRCEHNPAFAVACHVANALNVPVIVLAIVPDDASTPKHRSNVPSGLGSSSSAHSRADGSAANGSAIAMTSRRLAFHLEALSSACRSWSDHGAACAVRLHGPGCRTPDHLALARRVRFVVTDEPFVDPYLGLVQRAERAARGAAVPCVRVDGSTTVPPAAVLRRLARRRKGTAAGGAGGAGGGANGSGADTATVDDDDPAAPLLWEGIPPKAWMWQKRTEPQRMGQIRSVVMEGAFDAPELKVKIVRDRFFEDGDTEANAKDVAGKEEEEEEEVHNGEACPSADPAFLSALPPAWRNPQAAAPGARPWSTSDLASIANLKEFALSWPGADPTVPPCPQTTGTHRAGMARWDAWVRDRHGLRDYGRRRNDLRQPHAPSRMSCYLNLGIVSIYRLVQEVKSAQSRGVAGADKYEEEIVKWREMAYAFCFSRTDHCGVGAVPHWAKRSLEQTMASGGAGMDGGGWATSPFGWTSLALGQTGHAKWDAMQRYLVSTGELHNNVRMTWGKTVVGWSSRLPRGEGRSVTDAVLKALCYLNDRYALDGLSPPSYAGLLWCMGWCDKPGKGGGISSKPASNYRYSPEDFRFAERALLAGSSSGSSSAGTGGSQGKGGTTSTSMKHSASQSSILDMMKKQQQPKAKRQRTDDGGEEKESSRMKEIVGSASKSSKKINAIVKKKGSIASFFSPKAK